MGTISQMPRRERPAPARLLTDAESLEAGEELVAEWQRRPEPREWPQRRDALRASGLLAISLSADFGGPDCSNLVLADLVRRLAALDEAGAAALLRHYAVLEYVRLAADPGFLAQLAARVLAGDMVVAEPEAGRLTLLRHDFESTAEGALSLSPASRWADWLWVAAVEPGEQETEGAVLVANRFDHGLETSAPEQTRAPVSCWLPVADAARLGGQGSLGQAVFHLLDAARRAGMAPPDADVRERLRREGLLALISRAAETVDQAQVTPAPHTLSLACSACLNAVLLAADLDGDEATFRRLSVFLSPR